MKNKAVTVNVQPSLVIHGNVSKCEAAEQKGITYDFGY